MAPCSRTIGGAVVGARRPQSAHQHVLRTPLLRSRAELEHPACAFSGASRGPIGAMGVLFAYCCDLHVVVIAWCIAHVALCCVYIGASAFLCRYFCVCSLVDVFCMRMFVPCAVPCAHTCGSSQSFLRSGAARCAFAPRGIPQCFVLLWSFGEAVSASLPQCAFGHLVR